MNGVSQSEAEILNANTDEVHEVDAARTVLKQKFCSPAEAALQILRNACHLQGGACVSAGEGRRKQPQFAVTDIRKRVLICLKVNG